MLTCIARSSDESSNIEKLNSRQAIKTLSSQIKDVALKVSGAYRHCSPCANQSQSDEQQRRNGSFSGGESEKFRWSHRRTWSSNSGSTAARKELEGRVKGISSSGGVESVVFVEESEPKEWVAQVEPGVLITFVSSPKGANHLKRIRFSRETFNKRQAQRWWADNCEKVMELYNVERLNRQTFPLPLTTPNSEDDSSNSKMESVDSPVTPTLSKDGQPHTLYGPNYGALMGNSSDYNDACGVNVSTPELSSISTGVKTETSSMDASVRTSCSRDAGEIKPISNGSRDLESEWVEQDVPGVYITIRARSDGRRELKRVRFSRDKFKEMHARLWWEENRARINKQYLWFN